MLLSNCGNNEMENSLNWEWTLFEIIQSDSREIKSQMENIWKSRTLPDQDQEKTEKFWSDKRNFENLGPLRIRGSLS